MVIANALFKILQIMLFYVVLCDIMFSELLLRKSKPSGLANLSFRFIFRTFADAKATCGGRISFRFIVVTSDTDNGKEGVAVKEIFTTIVISIFTNVISNIIAYIICEWLGRNH